MGATISLESAVAVSLFFTPVPSERKFSVTVSLFFTLINRLTRLVISTNFFAGDGRSVVGRRLTIRRRRGRLCG